MSMIIRTRDGKEFVTPYLWKDLLSCLQEEVWIPIWELPTDEENEPCTTLIRSNDIVSISATTDEDRKTLHEVLDWADRYGGNEYGSGN